MWWGVLTSWVRLLLHIYYNDIYISLHRITYIHTYIQHNHTHTYIHALSKRNTKGTHTFGFVWSIWLSFLVSSVQESSSSLSSCHPFLSPTPESCPCFRSTLLSWISTTLAVGLQILGDLLKHLPQSLRTLNLPLTSSLWSSSSACEWDFDLHANSFLLWLFF